MRKDVCYSCRYLITELGFLKRTKQNGPCDRCLGQQTLMQQAAEKSIWLHYVPKKETKGENDGRRDTKSSQ